MHYGNIMDPFEENWSIGINQKIKLPVFPFCLAQALKYICSINMYLYVSFLTVHSTFSPYVCLYGCIHFSFEWKLPFGKCP